MEEEEGHQSGGSFTGVSGATMTRAQLPPGVSPSSINICRAYHAGRSHDTPMGDFEEDEVDEEDADYEEEEDEDDDDEEEEEDTVDEDDYEATNVISGTKYPTANLHFHEMLKVKLTLEQQHYEEDSEMGITIKYMKRKFKRYWKMTWLSLSIPVILDPQFKLKYLEYRFGLEFGDEAAAMIAKVKNVFQGLFKEYLKLNDNGSDSISQGGDDDMAVSDQDPMADWDKHVTLTARSTNLDSTELDSYLSKVPIRRSDQFNILAWWQMNSGEYPTLSRMAVDILAAPASTVASESAFSTGKRVLSDFRSRMTPTTLEALICLQDWIRATANTQRSLASVYDIRLDMQDNEVEAANTAV